MYTEQDVLASLGTVLDPDIHQDIVSLGFVKHIKIAETSLSFTVTLTTPVCPLKDVIRLNCEAAIHRDLPRIKTITITFDAQVRPDSRIADSIAGTIKNIIAVGSGKGGVGKSTVSVNIACALAKEGALVGLLDCDIYGPNIPRMTGAAGLPLERDEKIVPMEKHGIQIMSMGYLIPPNQALVWRGPMIHSAVRQLFTDVAWREIDYLIVDLPPGTGDAQMSLAQSVPVTGAIIVTMPQLVALDDARRGADAFTRLSVPVLGIVENMTGAVFGSGGGASLADELAVPFIGSIELEAGITASINTGRPYVLDHDDGISAAYHAIARHIAVRCSMAAIP
ncbi:MAG: Mrp/NBP35 family ATP-binding protein [Spirochaetales bacterium]|nr:Mrp/NBP35 family ATP-binding protein [Spirochaetales bacterium]